MIIASGLSAGEEVVTDGQLRLTPGAQVSTGGPRGGGAGNPEEGSAAPQGGQGRGRRSAS
jgi:hypothetical protein